MAIAIVGTPTTGGSAATGGASSFTLAKPTGLATNDFVLIWVTSGTGNTFTVPLFTPVTRVSGTASQQLFYRAIDGTESWPLTVTLPSSGITVGVCIAYRGVNLLTPFDPAPTLSGKTTAATTSLQPLAVTTTVNGDQLVWFGMTRSTATNIAPQTVTQPAGLTIQGSQANTTSTTHFNVGVLVADIVQVTAGATTPTGSVASATINGAMTVPLLAATAGHNYQMAGASATTTPSTSRALATLPSAVVTTSASLLRSVVRAVATTVTTSASSSTARSLLKTLSATVSTSSSVLRSAGRSVSATVTTSVSRLRALAKSISATVTTAASSLQSNSHFYTATAAVSTSASSLRSVVKKLAANVSTTPAISRSIARSVTASVSTLPSNLKALARKVSATVTTSASSAQSKSIFYTATATVSTSVSYVRSLVRSLVATVQGKGLAPKRGVSKTFSTAVSTAASKLSLRTLVRTFSATVSTSASVITRFLRLPRDIIATIGQPVARWITRAPLARWLVRKPKARWTVGRSTNKGLVMQEISSISPFEYARAPVNINFNPTADTLQVALVPVGAKPAVGDWKPAVWETISLLTNVSVFGVTTGPGDFYANCAVGSGGVITLGVGTYDMYVQITDSPETIVKRAGQVLIS